MHVLDLWLKATSRSMCHEHDCDECQMLYGHKRCASDVRITNTEMAEFVSRVTKLIRDRQSEETFDWEMTEDELVSLIMAADSENGN